MSLAASSRAKQPLPLNMVRRWKTQDRSDEEGGAGARCDKKIDARSRSRTWLYEIDVSPHNVKTKERRDEMNMNG